MYGVFTHIWLIFMANAGKYSSHMEHMFIDFQGAIVILCFQPSNPEVWAVRSSLATWFVISFVDFSFGKQRAAQGP